MKKGKWYGLMAAIAVIAMLLVPPAASNQSEDHIKALMAMVNAQLEAMGENFRLGVVEYYTAKDEAGQTVYFNNRTKQMGMHFVPGDQRRGG